MRNVLRTKSGFGHRIVLSVVFALFMCSGCSAYPSNADNSNQSLAKTDSVMRNAIGDSIYSIIVEAKKVKAEAVRLNNDSTSNVGEINVNSKDFSWIRFIISEPKNYAGDIVVYGKFHPCFTLTFIRKKESCIVNFDFGLKKWNVCDSKGRTLKTFDLNSDDMLRMADILFPNNHYFETLINTVKK